jgi:hypothetical protein
MTPSVSNRFRTSPYRSFIAELLRAIQLPNLVDPTPMLNGMAGQSCIELLSPKTLRGLGAYFTPSSMAAKISSELADFDVGASIAFDPSCGAGDLLLPIAAKLPLQETASATASLWNEHLLGCDLSAEFVRAARLRLVLLAVTRGVELDETPIAIADRFSNIAVRDGLLVKSPYTCATHVLMNPPFGAISAPAATEWRRGKTTAAALFFDRALTHCKPGTRVAAILPEVLRTGTSYRQWRERVESRTTVDKVESLGLFSANADVDVFLKRVTVKSGELSKPLTKPSLRRSKSTLLGDKFVVSVGPVVPQRHGLDGPRCAYLHAVNATAWKVIKRINESRRFDGKLVMPPFVVIRRTSRPGDPNRAIASLVLGSRPVAVENHLLVARPLRGGIPICKKLLRVLRSKAANKALDSTMRCRHLTTASVSGLAWP